MSEKLQKVLARSGIASRRAAEELIAAGRVSVNGKIAVLGDRIDTKAKVCVDDKPVKTFANSAIKRRVLLYNKPLGEVCTRTDEKDRPTVFEHLPTLDQGRWINVGRLDINSSGLLLFTNDGELANVLMHPSRQFEREYLVRVLGEVTPDDLRELRTGVELEDGMAHFERIQPLAKQDGPNKWFRVVVTEGRNRIVRRLWNAKNIVVNRLIRIRFCGILLPRTLSSGKYVELSAEEVKLLARKGGLK